jgi:hypothetical protein
LRSDVTEICQLVTANGRAWTPDTIDLRRIFNERPAVRSRGDAGAALARDLGMVCRAQVSVEVPLLSPIAFRSTPRWFTSRLAAGGAGHVAVAEYPGQMTGQM